jgi:hypothetical protein
MSGSSQKPQSLVEVRLVVRSLRAACKINAAAKQIPDMPSGRGDARVFSGNVGLKAGTIIYAQFAPLIDRPTESTVVLAGIDVVGVVFRVVNVFLRAMKESVKRKQAGKRSLTDSSPNVR